MTTQTFHAQWAWRGGEEAVANVRITVSNGVIASVEDGVDAQASDVRISGIVMPGFVPPNQCRRQQQPCRREYFGQCLLRRHDECSPTLHHSRC